MVRELIMSLADRIREQRKIIVTVGDLKFYGRRGTSEEFAKYSMDRTMDAEVARLHITGWEGVKESDLVDGGTKELIPFDRETFCEVIGDRLEWTAAIVKAVLGDAIKRITDRAANEKK